MLGVLGTTAKAVRKLNFRRKSRRFIRRPLYTPEELQAQRQQHFPVEPLFSIIVPLYNTPGDFLEEMLQSVLAQTYGKWELCLADGGAVNWREYAGRSREVLVKRADGAALELRDALFNAAGATA